VDLDRSKPHWRARQPRHRRASAHRSAELIAQTAPNSGAVIIGVCLWGVCFSNAGNVLAAPAEVIPRRHRGTSNQILQIGGFFGTTSVSAHSSQR